MIINYHLLQPSGLIMTTPHFFNRRLAVFRELKEINQESLSHIMGFKDRQTLSAIENGSRNLSPEELIKALEYMQISFEDFSDPYSLIGEASYSWRQNDASKEELTSFEEKTNRLIALYRDLRSQYASSKPSVILPKLAITKNSTLQDVQQCAEQLVEELELGDFPADALEEKLLSKFEMLTLYVDAPITVSGAAIKLDNLCVILINRNEVVGRRNFDVAHEAFHCLTWDVLPPKHIELVKNQSTYKPIEEKLADSFASALLMPKKSIDKYFPSLKKDFDESSINALANKFKVSSVALLWRLLSLRKITEADQKSLNSQLLINNGNSDPKARPILFNKKYVEYLHKALESGSLSVRKMATTLDITIDDLDELFRQYNLCVPFEI